MIPVNNYTDNGDVLIDTQPITMNRFGNNTYSVPTRNYPVSGAPISANPRDDKLGAQHKSSSFLPHTHCTGSGSKPHHMPTAQSCQAHCLNSPDCTGWTFNNRNQQCSLTNKPGPCFASGNYTSGIVRDQPNRLIGGGTRLSTNLPNVSFAGAPTMVSHAPNTAICRDSCLNNTNCNRWSFDPARQQCATFNGRAQVVSPHRRASSGEIYVKRGAPVLPPRH